MKRLTGSALLLGILVVADFAAGKHQAVIAQSVISGMWRGDSECVVKNSSCHDEVNVYRFSEVIDRPNWFSGTGSKVVNGREVTMGTLEWQYDPKSHILESKNPNGDFRFLVADQKMEGSLILADATVYRLIHLAKVK
jgi:hypothetical protein